MVDSATVPPLDSMPLDDMLARLHRVLAASPADETEIAWIEARRQRAAGGDAADAADTGAPAPPAHHERTLLIRVRVAGRTGFHRTGEASLSELESGVRIALAQARLAPRSAETAPPAASEGGRPTDRGPELFDPELAALDPARARDIVRRLAGRGGSARLAWTSARIAWAALASGAGYRLRSAEVTAASLEVRQGRRPAAGHAAGAARTLAGLAADQVAERARVRMAEAAAEPAGDWPAGPLPLLLAPEATAALVDLLNRMAFSSVAYREPDAFLRGRLGQSLFHPAITLRDDGDDPAGLPFPFDLRGQAKRPVDLIAGGVAMTPALDAGLAAELDRAATPHAVAFDESAAGNLFLLPGTADGGELLAAASDGGTGLWIGGLTGLEALDRRSLGFRATARGVRRIDGGTLGPSLPDLTWEGHLEDVLGQVLALGREVLVVVGGAGHDGASPLWGGIAAPALALGASRSGNGRLRPRSIS